MLDFANPMTLAERALKDSYNELALQRFAIGEQRLQDAIDHLLVALVAVQQKKKDTRVFK